MMKSTKCHPEDDEEAYDFDSLVARNDSSSGEMVRVDEKSSERKAKPHRTKHSETEQRRRSKINERFQTLRDLIPQNDQKRDKASFLLEVIEYIQFLSEKLQMYEGSHLDWNQGPTKLTPWRNHHRPVETYYDHPQVMKNSPGRENSVVPPAELLNVPNLMEPDLDSSAVYKPLHPPPSTVTSVLCPNVVTGSNAYASADRAVMSTQPMHEFISDAENTVYQSQPQFWSGRPCRTASAVLNTTNEQDDLRVESGLDSLSTAYSQGVLNTLTQALQSSGVDLSQTHISVDINIGKQANSGVTATTSFSKDHENEIPNNQGISQTEPRNYYEDFYQVFKRIKRSEI